jgi:hypothetical protein
MTSVVNLGDLQMPPALFSAKLTKAMAVLGAGFYDEFEKVGLDRKATAGSCVLAALAVREFLICVGFRAEVRAVAVVMSAALNGEPIHSLGIGHPQDADSDANRWAGHLVCVVPAERALIDPTLMQARRPAWPDLPAMICSPLGLLNEELCGLEAISAVRFARGDGYRFKSVWFDNPENRRWRNSGDAQRNKFLRSPVAQALVRSFGEWRD